MSFLDLMTFTSRTGENCRIPVKIQKEESLLSIKLTTRRNRMQTTNYKRSFSFLKKSPRITDTSRINRDWKYLMRESKINFL